MNFFWEGLKQAWELITSRDPALMHITWVTLEVVAVSTAIASIIGLPIGLALGLGRFRGRGILQVLANAGLALPPVVVGLFLSLLMFPAAPLGPLHLLFTLRGVFIAQTILALPVIVALTSSAVRDLPSGLLDQARAYGAGRVALGVLALREARVGVMAAVIAAIGTGLSEVGAVVLVGGNIAGVDQTLASATLQLVEAGQFAPALAVGLILLALIVLVAAILTWLQHGSARIRSGRLT